MGQVADPGIVVRGNDVTVDANSTVATFRNVIVEHGGNFTSEGSQSTEAALAAIDCEVEISGSTFRDASSPAWTSGP